MASLSCHAVYGQLSPSWKITILCMFFGSRTWAADINCFEVDDLPLVPLALLPAVRFGSVSRTFFMLRHGKLLLLYLAFFPNVARTFVILGLKRTCVACKVGRDHVGQTPPPLAVRWPLAVLRGLELERGEETVVGLYKTGFRMLSVTVDTPGFEEVLVKCCRLELPGMTIGASSVTTPLQVDTAFKCGAKFVSSMSLDSAVVRRTKEWGMLSIPGVATEAQAIAAIAAGGDILKVFPACTIPPTTVHKIVDVSSSVPVIVAGGVEVADLKTFSSAGVTSFAVGRTLFTPEMTLAAVRSRASSFMREGNLLPWREQRDTQDTAR